MRRMRLEDLPPETAERHETLRLHLYEEGNTLLGKAWRGRQRTPFEHFIFRSQEQREDWARRKRAEESARNQAKKVRNAQAERRREEMRAALTVGSVLYTSWGYDQTNVDFYEVVARTEHTVTVRKLAAECEEKGFMQGRTRPRVGEYLGKPQRRRILECGAKIGDHYARPTDPSRWHFVSWYA